MQPYNKSFAPAFQRMWTYFADDMGPRLVDHYKNTPHGEKMAPVLDLCCGTGTLALYFLAEGFSVVGVDLSEPMLEIARDNATEFIDAGKAEFVKGCVTEFETDEKFGLVVSTFDSLNHLDNVEQLAAVFTRALAALLPGGRLVFDLNTEKSLRRWSEITVDDNEDAMVVKRGGYDPRTRKAFYKASGFIRADDGRYDRFEELVVETVFGMGEVKDLLLRAGFLSAYAARYIDLNKQIDDPEQQDRVFFVASK